MGVVVDVSQSPGTAVGGLLGFHDPEVARVVVSWDDKLSLAHFEAGRTAGISLGGIDRPGWQIGELFDPLDALLGGVAVDPEGGEEQDPPSVF